LLTTKRYNASPFTYTPSHFVSFLNNKWRFDILTKKKDKKEKKENINESIDFGPIEYRQVPLA
jgi:hypothetical protein